MCVCVFFFLTECKRTVKMLVTCIDVKQILEFDRDIKKAMYWDSRVVFISNFSMCYFATNEVAYIVVYLSSRLVCKWTWLCMHRFSNKIMI